MNEREQMVWTNDRSAEPLVSRLDDLLTDPSLSMPTGCPACHSPASLHVHANRFYEPMGGGWVWCSDCRRYSHDRRALPQWWVNNPSVGIELEASPPTELEERAAEIDAHWNAITANGGAAERTRTTDCDIMASLSPSIDGRGTDWIPLLSLGGELWLGHSRDGYFVGDYESPQRIVDLDSPIGLLPCLKRPYDHVVADLEKRERELALTPGFLYRAVHLKSLPHMAFASGMDYWIQKGLDWLESMPDSERDYSILMALDRASWATQRARQRSRNLLLHRASPSAE